MRVEMRADKKSVNVSGYVNVVGRESRTLHDKTGPYTEQIAPGAFAKALKSGDPVELRFNHKDIIGSTADGTVELREDNVGLKAVAPKVTSKAVIDAAEAKELRGWSFGFVKTKDSWKTDDAGNRHRTVEELELREVSILTKTPAYIATSIETRGEDEVLVEFRADVVDDGEADYVRKTERETAEKSETSTKYDDSVMFLASKTVEIYKMKRKEPVNV